MFFAGLNQYGTCVGGGRISGKTAFLILMAWYFRYHIALCDKRSIRQHRSLILRGKSALLD